MQICQGEKIGKIDENTKKVNEVYTQVEKIEQIQNENITIINNIDQELEKQKAKSSTMVDLLKAQEIELNNYGQKIEELEKNNETKKN